MTMSKLGDETVAYQKKRSEMQIWWDEAIARNMDLPDGYSEVSVLLIKWVDEMDELRTGNEARELATLFKDRFNYHTQTVELNLRTKPQHQLNSHISNFINEHDGPHNLLIVYYTGHGVWREDRRSLELTATMDPALCTSLHKEARCNWNKIEARLEDEEVEADVLIILDTCYASNHVKCSREETRKLELLSACAIDSVTASPGKNSFTRALIDALDELLKEYNDSPFSTFRLNQRILIDKRRSDTPSQLWWRGQGTRRNEQHILLAPLRSIRANGLQQSARRLSPKGYLTLRFGLRDATLNQEQIEFMTKTLSRAFHNKAMVGLRRIEWLDIRRAPPKTHLELLALVLFVISQWKKVVRRRKEERAKKALLEKDGNEDASSEAKESEAAEAGQKRRYEDAGETPDAKRWCLDVEEPPSPVSNCSLVE